MKRFDGRATSAKLARRSSSQGHGRQRDGRCRRCSPDVRSWCRPRKRTLNNRGSKRHQWGRDAHHVHHPAPATRACRVATQRARHGVARPPPRAALGLNAWLPDVQNHPDNAPVAAPGDFCTSEQCPTGGVPSEVTATVPCRAPSCRSGEWSRQEARHQRRQQAGECDRRCEERPVQVEPLRHAVLAAAESALDATLTG